MIHATLAGRFRLEAEVGAGGMTGVWQAMDEVLERPVAVKIVHRHLLGNEVFCDRFRQEALAAGALIHPNIVAVYDTGLYDGAPYVIMEYLDGGSLLALLEREAPLAPSRVATIGAEVCQALAHAHRAGVVHRDLKPENVLLTSAGHVKVSDFGVAAAALGGDTAATGALIGTLSFQAPEVLDGAEPGPAADLYALGVVLFKALTGRSPRLAGSDFAPSSKGRLQASHPRDFRPDVPKDLDAVVARALSADPDQRFRDAEEMGRLLTQASQSRGPRVPATTPSPPARPSPPPVRRGLDDPPAAAPPTPSFVRSEGRWLAPVALLVLIAIGVVIGVLQLSGVPVLSHKPAAPAPAARPTVVAVPFVQGAGGRLKVNLDGTTTTEHSESVGNAFDGNPSTAWHTQTYDAANFNGDHPGVGIWGDLGAAFALSQIEVDSPQGGWQAAIRYSDDAQNWSDAPQSVTVGTKQDFDVSKDGAHRYWLVWITQLAPDNGGFDAQVSEMKAFR